MCKSHVRQTFSPLKEKKGNDAARKENNHILSFIPYYKLYTDWYAVALTLTPRVDFFISFIDEP